MFICEKVGIASSSTTINLLKPLCNVIAERFVVVLLIRHNNVAKAG
ncbi:hypothetical protein [Prevotella intermedia]|nr:hypothetical protein [Prevotella intermedia]